MSQRPVLPPPSEHPDLRAIFALKPKWAKWLTSCFAAVGRWQSTRGDSDVWNDQYAQQHEIAFWDLPPGYFAINLRTGDCHLQDYATGEITVVPYAEWAAETLP